MSARTIAISVSTDGVSASMILRLSQTGAKVRNLSDIRATGSDNLQSFRFYLYLYSRGKTVKCYMDYSASIFTEILPADCFRNEATSSSKSPNFTN